MKKGLHIDNAGTKRWYLHSKLHRQDGPAVVWADGTEYWYIHGKFLHAGVEGFWAHWALLTHEQRCNLNLHKWLAKYI